MKFRIGMVFILGFALAACSKEEIEIRPIDPDGITFGCEGGSKLVDFTKNHRWIPSSGSSWCRVSAYAWQPKDCSRLLVECEENKTFVERKCFGFIKLDETVDSVRITQKGRPYTVRFANRNDRIEMGKERDLTLVFDPKEAAAQKVLWSCDNEEYLKIDSLTGHVYAIRDGKVTITALTEGGLSDTCSMTITEVLPNRIDLGLSVKWADHNVGADCPEGYGDYYSWGDKITYYEYGQARVTTPQWKEGKAAGYDWKSYKFRDYRHGEKLYDVKLTKYNFDLAFGAVDNRSVLLSTDDVATEKYGDGWRMPTYEEYKELLDNCDNEWTVSNGVSGVKLTSRVEGYEGVSIFFPASGYRRYRDYSPDVNIDGSYWTSTVGSGHGQDAPFIAWHIYFREDDPIHLDQNYRCDGRTVRAVHD